MEVKNRLFAFYPYEDNNVVRREDFTSAIKVHAHPPQIQKQLKTSHPRDEKHNKHMVLMAFCDIMSASSLFYLLLNVPVSTQVCSCVCCTARTTFSFPLKYIPALKHCLQQEVKIIIIQIHTRNFFTFCKTSF